jgi:hypothetical protein
MASNFVFEDKDRVGQWVADQVEQTASWGDFYAMGVEDGNGEILAGVVFNNFNGSNATAHIAVKRFTRLFPGLIEHAFNYAFNQNKLNRVTGLVEADNEKALRLDWHIGFEVETTLRKGGAKGQDMIVLVMWPERCRWIQ